MEPEVILYMLNAPLPPSQSSDPDLGDLATGDLDPEADLEALLLLLLDLPRLTERDPDLLLDPLLLLPRGEPAPLPDRLLSLEPLLDLLLPLPLEPEADLEPDLLLPDLEDPDLEPLLLRLPLSLAILLFFPPATSLPLPLPLPLPLLLALLLALRLTIFILVPSPSLSLLSLLRKALDFILLFCWRDNPSVCLAF